MMAVLIEARLKLWVRSEAPGRPLPPAPPPLLRGEGRDTPPSLAGKGVGGLGFFKLDALFD